MTSNKEYKKLHREIETIISSRLQQILSQTELSDADSKTILELNDELGKTKKSIKNISGYNLFFREHFSQVKDDNPGTQTKDMLKIIASTWKEQNQDVKDDYNSRAKIIKPLTKEEKSKNKSNDKKQSSKTTKTIKSTKIVNKKERLADKLPSVVSSVKSTPIHSDTEQSQKSIKTLLAKLKSSNK